MTFLKNNCEDIIRLFKVLIDFFFSQSLAPYCYFFIRNYPYCNPLLVKHIYCQSRASEFGWVRAEVGIRFEGEGGDVRVPRARRASRRA